MVTKSGNRWFTERYGSLGLTLDEIGAQMRPAKLTKSSVSRCWKVDPKPEDKDQVPPRRVKPEEAAVFARVLKASIQDVYLNLGIEMPTEAGATKVVGVVLPDYTIRERKRGSVAAISDLPADAVALIVEDSEAYLAGFAFYFVPRIGIPPEAFGGSFCVVDFPDPKTPRCVCFVKPGTAVGKVNLVPFSPSKGEERKNVLIQSASPILATRAFIGR